MVPYEFIGKYDSVGNTSNLLRHDWLDCQRERLTSATIFLPCIGLWIAVPVFILCCLELNLCIFVFSYTSNVCLALFLFVYIVHPCIFFRLMLLYLLPYFWQFVKFLTYSWKVPYNFTGSMKILSYGCPPDFYQCLIIYDLDSGGICCNRSYYGWQHYFYKEKGWLCQEGRWGLQVPVYYCFSISVCRLCF